MRWIRIPRNRCSNPPTNCSVVFSPSLMIPPLRFSLLAFVLVSGAPLPAADLNRNGRLDPYEDASLPIEARIDDLLARMTTEEKTMQLVTLYGYCRILQDPLPTEAWSDALWKDGLGNIDEQLNNQLECINQDAVDEWSFPWSRHTEALNTIQRWFLEKTRLGIPVDMTNEGIRGLCHDRATNFPCNLALAATWNPALVEAAGKVIGREAHALGYTNIYAPILDLARDPRWGRTVETYGEDPFLVGILGAAMSRGIQSEGVASTLKHFAVYGIPDGGRDGDARTDPHVGPREMIAFHLEPFRRTIAEAGSLGVMSSYNDWDGLPITGSDYFLQYWLRDQFGFQGYVVSDSDAVEFLDHKHRVVEDYQAAIVRALDAGVNIRTTFTDPAVFIEPLRRAIAVGAISMATIDARVRDVLRVKFRLGLFDDRFRDPADADHIVRRADHLETAREAAAQSLVLLKNEEGALPIDATSLRKVLVTGPLADSEGFAISRYGPSNLEVTTVYEGIRNRLVGQAEVAHVLGCTIVDPEWPESELIETPLTEEESALIDEAVAQAREADLAVVVLGDSRRTVGESTSRTSLDLPGRQEDLLRAIHATGTPTVLILMSGRPVTINWADRHIPAILQAWQSNEFAGEILAAALTGDLNPGGKLPLTFPKTIGQIPHAFPFKRAAQAGPSGYGADGHGRSRAVGNLYAFGHGLSYTTFAYSALEIDATNPDSAVLVRCTVTNTGAVPGDEVAQLYLTDDVASLTSYESQLRGFRRITLAPGENREVTFSLSPLDLSLINRNMERVVEPGSFTVRLGSSSIDWRLEGSFTIAGDQPVVIGGPYRLH